jgi:hypothetical protein
MGATLKIRLFVSQYLIRAGLATFSEVQIINFYFYFQHWLANAGRNPISQASPRTGRWG